MDKGRLLNETVRVETSSGYMNMTALEYAAYRGRAEIFKIILEHTKNDIDVARVKRIVEIGNEDRRLKIGVFKT